MKEFNLDEVVGKILTDYEIDVDEEELYESEEVDRMISNACYKVLEKYKVYLNKRGIDV